MPTTFRSRLGRFLVAAITGATSIAALPVPAALAAPDDPGVVDVQPVPGEVVPAGTVTVTATLHAMAGVVDVSLVVDGEERELVPESADDDGTTPAAVVHLAAGHHIATVRVTDGEGSTSHRSWRFAAVDLDVHRLAGDDRVQTAVALSRHRFPQQGSATGAVIATAHDYPDGLAAAPLAAQVGGPLLLSATEALSAATAAELSRAVTPGGPVHLLGGANALADQVASDVAAMGFEVVRIAGSGRAETAAAIARRLPTATTAFVVSGRGFADGLAAAAPAARDGIPILLTEPDELSDATRAHLAEHRPDRVVIVGGRSAVSAEVEAAIVELADDVDRISGRDRYATAAAVAGAFYPDVTAGTIAVASGTDFPDALAGGPHAGALGMPLLLSPPDELPSTVTARMAVQPPTEVFLYGGVGALRSGLEGKLRGAAFDGMGAPVVTDRMPAPGTVINAFDTVELGLDRGVDLDHSTLHVTIAGSEVLGTTTQGDFTDRLVFQVWELPFEPQPDIDYAVQVHGQAYDGEHWRHVAWTFDYRRVALSRGDSGAAVLAIQERLTDLGYWLGEADGQFGHLTSQALMAFQKYEELPRSGVADEATRARLEIAVRPAPSARSSGRWVEIDKGRQVMLFIDDGIVEWAMNTSTGTEQSYTRPDGTTGFAHTPEGWFTFYRQIDGMREADLGQMWRPKYFTSAGHAIHGSTSIPAHPASHGCARLSYPAIDFVWAAGLAPIGTPLFVHA